MCAAINGNGPSALPNQISGALDQLTGASCTESVPPLYDTMLMAGTGGWVVTVTRNVQGDHVTYAYPDSNAIPACAGSPYGPQAAEIVSVMPGDVVLVNAYGQPSLATVSIVASGASSPPAC
jgi:hypothetical protein